MQHYKKFRVTVKDMPLFFRPVFQGSLVLILHLVPIGDDAFLPMVERVVAIGVTEAKEVVVLTA